MRHQVAIKKRRLDNILAMAIVVYFFFYEMFQACISYSFANILCGVHIFLAGIVVITHIRKKTAFGIYWLWGIVLCITLFNNRVLANRLYLISFFNYFSAMVVAFSLAKSAGTNWIDDYSKVTRICGWVYIIATLIFFVLPGVGEFQKSIWWGIYPNGTENGKYAYRAGLASSYSANGIYVSIALLSIAAPVISHFGTKHRIQKKEYIWVLLGAAALLLTAKRAHLLFTMSALIISYFALSEGKVENKFVRFIAIGIVLITTFVIACYFVPALSNTILRFTDNGGDISTGRFLFWEYAYKKFLQHPWLGIGWFGFRFEPIDIKYTAGYYDAHCIYIQLLCETGIIGFSVVVFAMISTWIDCVKLCKQYRRELSDKWHSALVASASIQIFMIIYGSTGNVLYDRCFIIYMMSLAVQWTIKYSLQRGITIRGTMNE